MNPDQTYDLLVIGAGPAGLSAAIAAKQAGMQSLVLDQGSVANSIGMFQRDMFFFSTPELLEIGDVPFIVPTVRPTSLDCVNYYRTVTVHFGLRCEFYERVVACERSGEHFVVKTARGSEYHARSAVVATGYYDTPNPLEVPGETLPHVTHYYRDPLPYFDQDVLVVGGRNSAVEAALDLYRHGARVTVVHRDPVLSRGVKYWILPDFENRVADGSIRLLPNTRVTEFRPGVTELESAGDRWTMKTGFAFILIGYRPDLSFLRSLGIAIDPETLAPVHDPVTMETNVPGLFVAGGLVGGKFNNKVFIENGREHGKKIVAALSRIPRAGPRPEAGGD